MSNLRDRIAAAIYGAASQWDGHPWDALAGHVQALYRVQADAVIKALGELRRCEDVCWLYDEEYRWLKADDE